ALLFNIIHGFTPDANKTLISRAVRALKPGGQIVILEQLKGRSISPIGNATSRLLSLSYFHLIDGKTYSFGEVARWLTELGLARVQRRSLLKAPGNYLVIATKM